MKKRPWVHRVAATGLLVGLGTAAIATQTGGVVRLADGPAVPVTSALHGLTTPTGTHPGPAPLITTVRATRLSAGGAVLCWLRPGCDTLLLPKQTGTGDPDTAMADSITAARTAAAALAGPHPAHPDAAAGSLHVDGIGGPSAGLTLTLYFTDLTTGGGLLAGHTVAATGTISPDGSVGPVGGVTHKVPGAVRAGADVLFVPASEVDQVPPNPNLTVVGVRTAADAVTWLCTHGATSAACH